MPRPAPSIEERRSCGKALRERLHRTGQSIFSRSPGFDLVATLLQSAEGRLPELLPVKWRRMAASPFGFFRGAVPVMAADLANSPRTGITVQMCGDAHVRNLGAYAAPDGRLIFDLNDFDETMPGPWEWDVKRLAASLMIAGREAGESETRCMEAVRTLVSSYRAVMQECSAMTVLELARYQVHRNLVMMAARKVVEKAERDTPQQMLAKLTLVKNGARRFKREKPLLWPVSRAAEQAVLRALESYRKTLSPERLHFLNRYRPEAVAFKIVGTGSVGTRDYAVLHTARPDDPLFLQVKEEPPPAYARHLPARLPRHNGRRVVEGQRLMQAQSDIFLGWTSIEGRDYLVRQLHDHKAAIDPNELKGAALEDFARLCGEILAKGHARSGDPCVVAGYCGSSARLDVAIATFSASYADQNEKDHKTFCAALRAGKFRRR
ncbi:MAG: DUF2252 domain-containing protein [Acidobacteria bacterium]|nr:DUF2252 domain-containing protein [Acidobacteriota bacterium]